MQRGQEIKEEVNKMHEKRTMRAVHETMGRIEVHTDRAGRICVSCMPITVEEKGPGPATRLAYAVGALIEGGACAGMVYMIARMAGIIPV